MHKKNTRIVLAFSFLSCLLFFSWNILHRNNPRVVHDREVRTAAHYGFEQDLTQSIQHRRVALKADPSDNVTRMMLASDLLETGETNEAVVLLKQVAASKNELSSGAKEVLTDLEKHGNTTSIPEKVRAYQIVLQANSGDGKTRYQMASLLSSLGKRKEATREFEQVVAQGGPFAVAAKNAIAAMKKE